MIVLLPWWCKNLDRRVDGLVEDKTSEIISHWCQLSCKVVDIMNDFFCMIIGFILSCLNFLLS